MILEFDSPAKVNLGLTIDNRPSQGEKHQLTTVMTKIPLADKLVFSDKIIEEIGEARWEDNDIESQDDNDAPQYQNDNDAQYREDHDAQFLGKIIEKGPIKLHLKNQKNLIWQAAEKIIHLAQEKKILIKNKKYFFTCEIEKNIPLGAGLGGGSSNAAVALKALNKLWGFNFSDEELLKLAHQLGSDVPFFMQKGKTYLELFHGSQDKSQFVQLLDLPGHYLLLVCPQKKINTRQAFSDLNYEQLGKKNLKDLVVAIRENNLIKIMQNLYNDFSSVLPDKYPFLLEVKNDLEKIQSLGVIMSGSGSSFVAFYNQTQNKENLKKIAQKLSSKYQKVYLYEQT